MPFILKSIGGTEAHAGYALAANSFGYMCGLLATGSILHHLNAKRATRAAIVVGLLGAVVTYTAISFGRGQSQISPTLWIWTIITAGTVAGAAMAFFWPFLMNWVSGGYEGNLLNRRFGRYNSSWSGGGLVGPIIGASLVEVSPLLPMLAAAVCLATCYFVLGYAQAPCVQPSPPATKENNSASQMHPKARRAFRWMARIALFCSWACLAIFRSQFALLFVAFGFSESQFGIVLTVFFVCNFLVLTVAGRVTFWHFRPVLLFAAQVILVIAVVQIVWGSSLMIFVAAAVTMGCAFGFAYSSHLYYGTLGSTKRSVRMAIHEITISLGTTIGSAGGGYLAKNVGLYWPYWFAIALLVIGLAGQFAIYSPARRVLRQAA
jgi:MFS family permease